MTRTSRGRSTAASVRPRRSRTTTGDSEPGLLTATLNWYRALDNKRLGSPVAAPTLYVWGSEDQAFGATAATATGRFVTGPYQFAPLEGASHWLPEEAPETIARLLLAHIGKFPA